MTNGKILSFFSSFCTSFLLQSTNCFILLSNLAVVSLVTSSRAELSATFAKLCFQLPPSIESVDFSYRLRSCFLCFRRLPSRGIRIGFINGWGTNCTHRHFFWILLNLFHKYNNLKLWRKLITSWIFEFGNSTIGHGNARCYQSIFRFHLFICIFNDSR